MAGIARPLSKIFWSGHQKFTPNARIGHGPYAFCKSLVITAMNVDLVGVRWDLSILLAGFLSVVWFAAGMIGVLACQHFFTRTPMALQHTPPATGDEQKAASCNRHETGCGVHRDVELERGMT